MTLQASGPITLDDIATEFEHPNAGGLGPISLNEFFAGGLYVPAGTVGYSGNDIPDGSLGKESLSLGHFYSAENGFSPDLAHTAFVSNMSAPQGAFHPSNAGLGYIQDTDRSTTDFNEDTIRGRWGWWDSSIDNVSFMLPNFASATDSLFTFPNQNFRYSDYAGHMPTPPSIDLPTFHDGTSDRTIVACMTDLAFPWDTWAIYITKYGAELFQDVLISAALTLEQTWLIISGTDPLDTTDFFSVRIGSQASRFDLAQTGTQNIPGWGNCRFYFWPATGYSVLDNSLLALGYVPLIANTPMVILNDSNAGLGGVPITFWKNPVPPP